MCYVQPVVFVLFSTGQPLPSVTWGDLSISNHLCQVNVIKDAKKISEVRGAVCDDIERERLRVCTSEGSSVICRGVLGEAWKDTAPETSQRSHT